jgi:hypothetical protein
VCGRLESPAGAPVRSSLSSPPDSAGASLPYSAGVSLPPRMGPYGTRGRHAATLALRCWNLRCESASPYGPGPAQHPGPSRGDSGAPRLARLAIRPGPRAPPALLRESATAPCPVTRLPVLSRGDSGALLLARLVIRPGPRAPPGVRSLLPGRQCPRESDTP